MYISFLSTRFFIMLITLVITLVIASSPSYAVEVRLAVASNFRVTLDTLVKAYQEKYEGNFSISAASTGVLYAQIKQGAPFDIFFSADKDTAHKISIEINKRSPTSPFTHAPFTYAPFTYAHGLLTFWCASKTASTPKSLTELQQWRGDYAIANPKLAPYGKASTAVIKQLNWPSGANGSKTNKEIMGNNVSQVAQFILTKNVDCGFVAKSLSTKESNKNKVFILPQHTYEPIIQQALVLPNTYNDADKAARVQHFVEFIQQEARELIAASGYGLPSETKSYYVHNSVTASGATR